MSDFVFLSYFFFNVFYEICVYRIHDSYLDMVNIPIYIKSLSLNNV